MKKIILWIFGDLRIGRVSQWLFRENAHCLKCYTSYALVDPHRTEIKGTVLYPLCIQCWRELEHPMMRVQYYLMLYQIRQEVMREIYGKSIDISFDEVRRIVLEEGQRTPIQIKAEGKRGSRMMRDDFWRE
jgi:hypothetical protein